MTVFQGLVLGVVQGIAEWLPISSEGIITLILLHFFQKPLTEAIQLSIWLHTGTVLAAEVGLILIDGVSFDLAALSGIAVACLFGILTIGALLELPIGYNSGSSASSSVA